MSENAEQAALFEWASYKPELSLMYAIANGGYRTPRNAAILKQTGVKSGTPDICLPVPKGNYGALYIEMKKAKGGRTSVNQRMCINALNEAGNKAVVCMGFEQAKAAIESYMAL